MTEKIKKTKETKETKNKKVVSKKTSKKVELGLKTSSELKTDTKKISKTVKKNNKKVSIISKYINNLNFIKHIFQDVFLLFRNFIHWNISKVLIFGWSILLGFISIIPLVIIFFIYSIFSDVNISMLIMGLFNGILLPDFLGNIILLLTVITFIISFSYSNVLLIRVNNSYKKGIKLDFKKNEYFNVKKIIKYFNVTLLNIVILLIPVFIFTILMLILFLFSGSLDEINVLVNTGINNYFTIFSFLFLIINILFGLYLYYRIIFSYFIFSDDKIYKEDISALSYVKKSFNKTKKIKKFLKFIVIMFIFIALTAPVSYIGKVLENNGNLLNNYVMYLSLTDFQKEDISSDELYYYETLKIEFNGLDISAINKKIKLNYINSMLYVVFSFLVLNGLLLMVFSSFYKRELA